jgi:hypothetical protein
MKLKSGSVATITLCVCVRVNADITKHVLCTALIMKLVQIKLSGKLVDLEEPEYYVPTKVFLILTTPSLSWQINS